MAGTVQINSQSASGIGSCPFMGKLKAETHGNTQRLRLVNVLEEYQIQYYGRGCLSGLSALQKYYLKKEPKLQKQLLHADRNLFLMR